MQLLPASCAPLLIHLLIACADDDQEDELDSSSQPLSVSSHSAPVQSKAAEPVPVAFPVARSPSPPLCIPQPAPAAHDDAPAEHLSPTLSQTSPENAAVGAVEPAADDVEESELDVVQPNEALHDALVLAEARRLIQQLQHIGFPVCLFPCKCHGRLQVSLVIFSSFEAKKNHGGTILP